MFGDVPGQGEETLVLASTKARKRSSAPEHLQSVSIINKDFHYLPFGVVVRSGNQVLVCSRRWAAEGRRERKTGGAQGVASASLPRFPHRVPLPRVPEPGPRPRPACSQSCSRRPPPPAAAVCVWFAGFETKL